MEPKIRLKGFLGEWKSYTYNEVFTLLGDMGHNVQKTDYCERGLYPIVDQSKEYIVGYTDKVQPIDGSSGIVVFGDHTREFKYIDFPFCTGADGTKLLKNLEAFDSRFSYYLCKSLDIPNTGYNRHFKYVKEADYYAPTNKVEQQAIGAYFQHLDSLIQTAAKKIDSLKQVKAASLQSMFPQEGETTPRIRMGKRIDLWKRCKLNEILVERHEASTITQDLPQLSFTIAEGVIRPEDRKSNQRDFLIKDKDNKRYLITRVGDIIYNPANVVYGAIHRNSLIDGVVSPIYKIFTTNQDSRFIECVVRRPIFISQLAMRTEGTVTKLKTLKPEAFLDMTVIIPTDLEEQRMIGEYFRNLDSQIDLQTQRLEKLKQIKSACLDNMFV